MLINSRFIFVSEEVHQGNWSHNRICYHHVRYFRETPVIRLHKKSQNRETWLSTCKALLTHILLIENIEQFHMIFKTNWAHWNIFVLDKFSKCSSIVVTDNKTFICDKLRYLVFDRIFHRDSYLRAIWNVLVWLYTSLHISKWIRNPANSSFK